MALKPKPPKPYDTTAINAAWKGAHKEGDGFYVFYNPDRDYVANYYWTHEGHWEGKPSGLYHIPDKYKTVDDWVYKGKYEGRLDEGRQGRRKAPKLTFKAGLYRDGSGLGSTDGVLEGPRRSKKHR